MRRPVTGPRVARTQPASRASSLRSCFAPLTQAAYRAVYILWATGGDASGGGSEQGYKGLCRRVILHLKERRFLSRQWG